MQLLLSVKPEQQVLQRGPDNKSALLIAVKLNNLHAVQQLLLHRPEEQVRGSGAGGWAEGAGT